MKFYFPPCAQALSTTLLCGLLLSLLQPAHAISLRPLRKKPAEKTAAEQIQTYQPPPENAIQLHCEPYRLKAAQLNQKPFFERPFYWPERTWAMHQHRTCTGRFMQQEYLYLKHVDIELSPQLPKLKTDSETPTSPSTPDTPAHAQ